MSSNLSDIEIPVRVSLQVEEKAQIVGTITISVTSGDRSTGKLDELAIDGSKGVKTDSSDQIRRRLVKSEPNGSTSCQESPRFHFPTLDEAQNFARKFWDATVHHWGLPEWLRDNEYLHFGHRPPTPSFAACFRSIFSLHTETVNIWTHMLGCALFVAIAVCYFSRPMIHWQEKVVCSPFFVGAIACLGASSTFHTVCCHSEHIGRLFNKLD